jgi:hypothetical protein
MLKEKIRSSYNLPDVLPILGPDESFRVYGNWAAYTIGRDPESKGGRYYVEIKPHRIVVVRVFFQTVNLGTPVVNATGESWISVHDAEKPGVGENVVHVPLCGWARV